MGEISLNTRYLSTNRGIIKILQIVAGFIICSLLCAQWYGGRSCFGEGRLGFCSGLNFICVVINIVLFVLNFLNISAWGLERIYSVVCTVLFLIAAALIIWFIIEYNTSRGTLIASAVSPHPCAVPPVPLGCEDPPGRVAKLKSRAFLFERKFHSITFVYGGRSCFGEGRLGFCSGLNFICVVINIVLFVLNFLNISAWGLERIYSVVCTVLFLIAAALIIWFIIEYNTSRGTLIASAVSPHPCAVPPVPLGCEDPPGRVAKLKSRAFLFERKFHSITFVCYIIT
ncbi:hypothetical protein OESDEN_09367 [Oesophagostomum dentatum]|uniref:MARVEL domain-containing protein n=1 Tax=Oesophagostomum dentatum TaxID=61180 RepID=A0A0B1T0M7_OESDE|nr:hypothetical protein OESDEN_09367 [Oesophagostomum dentatum]